MSNNDRYFMLEAIKEAEKSSKRGDWPIGCVIVLNDQIISRGNNKVYSNNNKLYHAEIDAMSKISKLLAEKGNEMTMYVSYEPCPMCLGAMMLNHIKRVVSGTNIDKSGALCLIDHLPQRFKESKYSFELVENFMEKECEQIFLTGRPVKKLDL